MRALAILAVLGGCFSSPTQDSLGIGSGSGSGNGSDLGAPDPCMVDADCTLVAATCCACPAFAVATTDPYANACTAVQCPPPGMDTCPTSLTAACRNNVCITACTELACSAASASCTTGFATDAAGCLTCDCAPPIANGCKQDLDCVEVAADCCGCQAGGTDTAVLASEASAYTASLGCAPDVHCPPMNTCVPDASPRCVQGACALVTGALPANACGRSDLPACPSGQACLVNRDAEATAMGIGVCGSP